MNTLWEQMFDNIKKTQPAARWNEVKDPDAIYHHLHGKGGAPPPTSKLTGPRMWVKGYTSKRCATVNAEGMVKVYYDRCCQKDNIDFVIGTPVDRLLYGANSAVDGVVLEDGRELRAEKTIIATGAWSSRLVNLDHQMHANAVGIAYIKLSPEEYEKYKDIPCHTNLVTGINIFTPLGGYLKILRRTAGLRNTTTLKDPEDPTKTYRASYPLTRIDDPTQTLSADMEQSIRAEMREILPQFANHPFARTKFCWSAPHHRQCQLERNILTKFAGLNRPRMANSSFALTPSSATSTSRQEVPCMDGNFCRSSVNSSLIPSAARSKTSLLRNGRGNPRPMRSGTSMAL